jgi:ATP-dependent helicase HrpB
MDALPELRRQLAQNNTVILQAPPGAGKSTVLPIELLDEAWMRGQRMLMLEPRRIAARSIATRMSQLIGESTGQTVGYRVRFDQRVGARTRIEVLTEGILTRRLQSDAELRGVGLVIFDEFHERSMHADLALALCREAQHALRDDLRILVMSATLDGDALSRALSNAPIVSAQGRQFPVSISYAARDSDAPIAQQVSDAVARVMQSQDGDVLAFLPGAGEIQRAEADLRERNINARICALYGDLSLDAQQAAILPDPDGARKVVLATSIAETSLTIEGVRVVVDSGYTRAPRFDASSGLTRLETVRITRDSADQRAGRAGRLAAGACMRLWTEATHARLGDTRRPEIVESDLAALRLELAQWGMREVNALSWITAPPVGAIRQAEELLTQLGALDANKNLSERGRAMLELPTHPRLAHALLESRTRDARLCALATDVVALLDERDPLPRGDSADLTLRVEALRYWRATKRAIHNSDARLLARIEQAASQWRRELDSPIDNDTPDPYDIGWLVMQAYPDRIAQQRANDETRYKLSGGRGVSLTANDTLTHQRWLAVAHMDAGAVEGRAFLAAPLHEDDVTLLAQPCDVVGWDERAGALVARREQRVGELVLSSKALAESPIQQKIETLCAVVRKEGLRIFAWSDAVNEWRARVSSLHIWRGDEYADLRDEALLARLDEWLAPHLSAVNKRADFARLDGIMMLRGLLSHSALAQLDRLAPTHVSVPSGSRIRLSYDMNGAPPQLAVKLQEMFGCADTPTVNDGRMRVTLHLLSPAQRPIQVTQDLRSFWNNTYPEVRKELRGRYNKHPWPEDPWNAPPTRRTVRRG